MADERRPLYYPLVEQGVYPSVAAACAAIGRPAGALDGYVANAAVEASGMVVCDRIALGNPALKVRAVLSFGEDGEVSLWAGFFGKLSESRADAVAFLEMRGRAGWTGRQAVGEWRPDGPEPADVRAARTNSTSGL